MFKVVDRARLIIYMSSLKPLPNVKHYGEVKYVSRQMHYVILFVNRDRVHEIVNELKQLKFVKKIFGSPIFSLSRELIKKTINELPKEGREP